MRSLTPIVEMRFGSHLYGTATPASDTDLKGIHLPAALDILTQRTRAVIASKTKEDNSKKNSAEDIDRESFALHKYLALVVEGQTVAMDMLFAPDSMLTALPHPAWWYIQANTDKLVSRQCKSFIGYCRQQANKYGVRGSRVASVRRMVEFLAIANENGPQMKLGQFEEYLRTLTSQHEHMSFVDIPQANGTVAPHLEVCDRKAPMTITVKEAYGIYKRVLDAYGQRAMQAERNEGVDWKALSHAVRVGRQAIELLETGRITFPRPEAEHLLAIKTGQLTYQAVAEEIEHLFVAVEAAAVASRLPDQPDIGFIDQLVCEFYGEQVRSVR